MMLPLGKKSFTCLSLSKDDEESAAALRKFVDSLNLYIFASNKDLSSNILIGRLVFMIDCPVNRLDPILLIM